MLMNLLKHTLSQSISENTRNLSSFINLVDKSLTNIFESIVEKNYNFIEDLDLSNGILKIDLKNNKTYIINIQKNNKQIWLSSPFSGPKRFEYINNEWIDIHNNKIKLYELLNSEFNNNYKLIGNKKLKLL
mgnify:CR=1 FL=1